MAATIADVLGTVSSSKFEAGTACEAKFLFRYLQRSPFFGSTAALEFGNALDETGNHVYGVKMEAERTPSRRDAQDRFAADWDYYACAVEDWQGASKGALLDRGVAGVALWRDRIAVAVEPIHTQRRLVREVQCAQTGDRFKLEGIVDLQARVPAAAGGRIETSVDLKSSRRRYPANSFTRKVQPVIYSLLTDVPAFEYHVLTTAKTPQTQVLRTFISNDDRAAAVTRIATWRRRMAHAAATGDWMPNRAHQNCSRRYCPHWFECEKTFGGKVSL